jgi:uncharacterized protein (DUF427 family)
MVKESVWDYPRPPKVEASSRRVRVEFNGVVIADTTQALRVLETSHPPVYYIPRADILPGCLEPSPQTSWCEFKGIASYWNVRVADQVSANVGWSYDDAEPAYASLNQHVAFYPGRVDACFVDDERVTPQPGGFYGGWITSELVGPFKGEPGSAGW